MSVDEQHIVPQVLESSQLAGFKVKKIDEFIKDNQYRHLGLLFSPTTNLQSRYEHAYHLIMGKDFDSEYSNLYAYGLLDMALLPIMASHLWRAASKDDSYTSTSIASRIVAAPILSVKIVLGAVLMLGLAGPIYGMHKAIGNTSSDPEDGTVISPFKR